MQRFSKVRQAHVKLKREKEINGKRENKKSKLELKYKKNIFKY